MIKKTTVVYCFLLIVLFALSVSFRVKHINQPLSRHHEWLTAHTLMTLSIWDKESAGKYFYSPVYSFNHTEDKKIGLLGGIEDKEGNDYYVSYGPFAFIAPYTLFKLFHIPISVTALQWFNIFFHFISAFFILLCVNIVYKKKIKDGFFLPSFIAYGVYLFMPCTLWFQGNVYFSDTLVQAIVIVGIYFLLKIINKAASFKNNTGLGICVFLGIYTEWLGLFFAFIAFVILGIKAFKNKAFLKPLVVIALCTIAALGLIIFQYAQISGLEKFLDYWVQKYTLRSGAYGVDKSQYGYSIGNPASFKYLETHYNSNYLNIINLFAFLIPAYVALCIFKKKFIFSKKEGPVILIAALLVLLHHLSLFNFTAVHDFSTLKTAILFTFLIAFISKKIILFSEEYLKEKRYWLQAVLVIFIGVKCYHGYTKFESKNTLADINKGFYEVGLAMKENGMPDETMATNGLICPEMMYYAQRNPLFIDHTKTLRNILDWSGKSVLWVKIKPHTMILTKVVRYYPNGDSAIIR